MAKSLIKLKSQSSVKKVKAKNRAIKKNAKKIKSK